MEERVFVYTATAGLGDYLVMGALCRLLHRQVPGLSCLVVHRRNPHVHLWPDGDPASVFHDVYAVADLRRLGRRLRQARQRGAVVFGLQMAPGSLQGYALHTVLKGLRLVDYRVDFNLINADIVTLAGAEYIIDRHLAQASQVLGVDAGRWRSQLAVPVAWQPQPFPGRPVIGVHPWSRRGHCPSFVWPRERWLSLIAFLLDRYPEATVVVFGRDPAFPAFATAAERRFAPDGRLRFAPSADVPQLVGTIAGVDLLVSVNTSVIHIGHLLDKAMVILNGPSLELWLPPAGPRVAVVRDATATFPGNDRCTDDRRFPQVARIPLAQVAAAVERVVEASA